MKTLHHSIPSACRGGGPLDREGTSESALENLGVWRFTLRFVLPGFGLATPVDLERRAVNHWTQSLPFFGRVVTQ